MNGGTDERWTNDVATVGVCFGPASRAYHRWPRRRSWLLDSFRSNFIFCLCFGSMLFFLGKCENDFDCFQGIRRGYGCGRTVWDEVVDAIEEKVRDNGLAFHSSTSISHFQLPVGYKRIFHGLEFHLPPPPLPIPTHWAFSSLSQAEIQYRGVK